MAITNESIELAVLPTTRSSVIHFPPFTTVATSTVPNYYFSKYRIEEWKRQLRDIGGTICPNCQTIHLSYRKCPLCGCGKYK